MEKRIIYKNDQGGVSVIVPWLGSGLTIEQIAAKDVPFGRPYKVVDMAELPQDRAARNLWTVDDAILTDGVGADYGAGSENDVVRWAENGRPITRRRQPPAQSVVEATRPSPIKLRTP